jgi:regulator of sigma E protease
LFELWQFALITCANERNPNMVDMVSSVLNQGLAYIVPMIVLLGLLIFVHELGHFLAAKFYKVGVETFSLGFGPKIIKFVRNGTVYCVSALPLGGYVKMFGDEPGKEISDEDRQRSYLHKPVGQRIVIVLAGPLMNLFFAAILFYWIAWIGDKAVSPTVGEIAPNSVAYETGFRPYDKVVSVNGETVRTWDEIKKTIEQSPGKKLMFSIDRQGETKTIEAKPVSSANDNLFSTADRIGKIKGLTPDLHLPVVGVSPESAIYRAGLRSGDLITAINGQNIKWFKDIEPTVLEALFNEGGRVDMVVRRFDDFRKRNDFNELTLNLEAPNFTSQDLGLFIPETMVAEVQEDSPAAAAGLMRMDHIIQINDNKIFSFEDIITNVSTYDPDGEPLSILVQREGEQKIFKIRPQMNSLEGQYGETENRFTIGVVPILLAMPNTFLHKSESVSESAKRALEQTYHWTKVTMLSFVRILQARVSSKNISGIISIGQVAQQSWSLGLNAFLKIMAIISINLFILNLLPIPILDGGHLVLFTLEAIKGSPVSLKKVEIAQQVGFLIILFLMAFALFNDFARIFGS